jgi:hypothetical protein
MEWNVSKSKRFPCGGFKGNRTRKQQTGNYHEITGMAWHGIRSFHFATLHDNFVFTRHIDFRNHPPAVDSRSENQSKRDVVVEECYEEQPPQVELL